MKITMRDRYSNRLDDLISPEDHILLHCVQCDVYFLPREIGYLKRRNGDTWDIVPICPVPDCGFPNSIESVTRHEYETRKKSLIEVIH